jgi:hypothetical protein
MVEGELMRQLVDAGGQAAERCLVWPVDAVTKPHMDFDLVWPTVPMPL